MRSWSLTNHSSLPQGAVVHITIPKPIDAHVHFRTGELMHAVVPYTAAHFAKALVMPNTKPEAIQTPPRVAWYRQAILTAAGSGHDFEPLMTFEIREDTDERLLFSLKKAGAIAGKVYPKGLTTGAEHGVQDYARLAPVLTEMERLDLVLCLHGEQPGDAYTGKEREAAFVRETLPMLATQFPYLRIVLEHISTAAGCEAVLRWPKVAGSITLHHLLLTEDDVGGDHMSPNNYCKPMAKTRDDRRAVLQAALWGHPKFFFGSDSAPHPLEDKKQLYDCCAGVFTAPIALPYLTHIFEQHGALTRLQAFTHDSAVRFYGLSEPCGLHRPKITLVKEPWEVPAEYNGIATFWPSSTSPRILNWQVVSTPS